MSDKGPSPRDKSSSSDDSAAAVLAALAANVGVAAIKLIAFLVTRSAAMLAEAVHSGADTTNELLLVYGRRAASVGPTRRHPFGHARDRYVFAFVVSIVLFVGSGAVAVWRGIERLRSPSPVEHAAWAIGVVLASAVFEGLSLRTAARRANRLKGDRDFGDYWYHAKTPELVVVLVEDFGALLGLGIALVGVGLSVATGDGRFDAGASIAIGTLMLALSVVLWRKTRSLLLGEAALPSVVDGIEAALSDGRVLLGAQDLRTQHLGPRSLLVAAHVKIADEVPARELVSALDHAKRRIRDAVGHDCLVYLDPA